MTHSCKLTKTTTSNDGPLQLLRMRRDECLSMHIWFIHTTSSNEGRAARLKMILPQNDSAKMIHTEVSSVSPGVRGVFSN